MNTPLGVVDTQPPSAPANLSASGSLSSVSLSWSASTDNVGVARYDLYRSTTPGFTPGPTNRIAQPTGTSYTDTGLQAGTYYYKVQAEDQAGNLSAPSNEASASVTGDTTPPSTPSSASVSLTRRPPRIPFRRISVMSAMIPPSPSLSARMTSRT